MFHVFDVQDMETFNVAAQNFVSEAGSENGISEWAEKIMDPVGVSWEFPPELKWGFSWRVISDFFILPEWLDLDFFQWEVGEQ